MELIPSPKVVYDKDKRTFTITVQLPAFVSDEAAEQTEKAATVVADYLQLFACKQHAYGKGNIAEFGELGVLIRANDKVNRLKQLVYRNGSSDLESVQDTWEDLLGYSVIGKLVHQGLW